jgi:hypothetical protein
VNSHSLPDFIKKKNNTQIGLDMVAVAYIILATREAEIGKIMVGGQPRQNVCDTPSQTIAECGSICLSF